MAEYPLTLQVKTGDYLQGDVHAARVAESGPRYETACGLALAAGQAHMWPMPTGPLASVNCPKCQNTLRADKPLTINGLVEMAYGTAKIHGWHELHGVRIGSDNAYAQLAGLAPIAMALARVVEAVRKPHELDPKLEMQSLWNVVDAAADGEVCDLYTTAAEIPNEIGELVTGSKAQVLAWLMLLISEAAEAMEAVIKGDRANFREEMADIGIRWADDIGAINDTPMHFLGPIDPEAEILAKNAINEKRPIRHGGKRA